MSYNTNTPQTPAAYLRIITMIHLALTVGQVMFVVIVLLLNKRLVINVRDTHDPFLYVVPAMAIACFFLSKFIFSKLLANAVKADTLKQKLVLYQAALIARLALLEGSSLFAIVVFFLTGQLFFLVIAVMLIAYFIFIRPTKANIEEALELSYLDKQTFSQGNEYLQ